MVEIGDYGLDLHTWSWNLGPNSERCTWCWWLLLLWPALPVQRGEIRAEAIWVGGSIFLQTNVGHGGLL